MMKLQDVLLKAMAKKIRWWDAAEIIGVTDRTMRRWRERLEIHGYSGLVDRRKGRASDREVPVARVGGDLGPYPGRLLRSEHAALPRKTPRGTRDRTELHLGAKGAAGSGAGGARTEAPQASPAKRAASDARNAAAH